MNLLVIDNALPNIDTYVEEILKGEFKDESDGVAIFKGIQKRPFDDDFTNVALGIFPQYRIAYNFVRKSPLNQEEPNFKHRDDMMGDITVILYLNENPPKEDGTTIYNDDETPSAVIHSKFNRMVAFDSDVLHSRNIFENFGEGNDARLIQVIFLKEDI
jgi:hypothetical protein